MADIQMADDVASRHPRIGYRHTAQNDPAAQDEVTVSIITDDPIAGDSVRMYLRVAGIRTVPAEQAPGADVVLVVTITLTEELLAIMREIHQAAANPQQCMVLVADPPTGRHLARAFRSGVVSIVPRRDATREYIVDAVQASGHGSAVLSGPAIRWLADNSRNFEQTVMSAHGITAGGLTVREADVLRLLADGMSTAEIARQLNYAERTIKNIIADMLSRLHLRNRIQAVAYAYRVGALLQPA